MSRVAIESAAVFAPSISAARSDWVPLARALAVVYVATTAVLAVALAAGHHHGVWLATLTRDPNQAAGIPFYVGIVSNLGILLWHTAAVACLFAAALLRRDPARREDMSFLASLGTLTAVLMLDDFFMVHDEVFPKYLGVPEEPIEALYVLMTLALMLRFRRLLLRPQVLLFLSALALFAVSILIEYAPDGWFLKLHIVEDGSKLLGIAHWLAYALWASLERVHRHGGPRHGPPNPPALAHAPGDPGRGSITGFDHGPDHGGPRHGPPNPPALAHAPGDPGRGSITGFDHGPDHGGPRHGPPHPPALAHAPGGARTPPGDPGRDPGRGSITGFDHGPDHGGPFRGPHEVG